MSNVKNIVTAIIGLSGTPCLCACSPQYGSTSLLSPSFPRLAASESPRYLYQYGGDAAARQEEFTPVNYVSGGSPSYDDPREWSSPAAFHTSRYARDGAESLLRRASLQPAPSSSGFAPSAGVIPSDGEYRLNMPVSSAMVMCRSAMARAGWERHPDYDVFRRGGAQVAFRLTPVGADTAMTVKSGASLVSDDAWQAALAKKTEAKSDAKPEGDKEKEKK